VSGSEGPRLTITNGMRRILDYPKFRGPVRMLVLETQYFFDKSWRRAAEELGWQTAAVPSVMVGNLTREHVQNLFTTLGEFRPDFILTSNYAGMDTMGMFSRFFEDARIPYVSWFTDTPRMILYDRQIHCSYYSVAATWERAYTKHFEDLGFEHVLYLPLATDPAVFNGEPTTQTARDLAFVGTSMIEEAGEAWEKLEHLPQVAQAIRDALDQGHINKANFTQGIHALLDPSLLRDRDRSELRHIELCIIYEATRRERAALVKRLEPYGVEVRGDPGWQQVARCVGGTVSYFDSLAPHYRSTAINLNATSLQMKTGVNQRVFDCPAAGGFLITDAQDDLNELFEPGSEVVTYATLDELEDKVRYYLNHPQERTAITARARKRVLGQHTHRHRLQTLEAFLRERYQT